MAARCGGCHKIGLKGEENIQALKANGAGFGVASCDACHTRHLFSVEEARVGSALAPWGIPGVTERGACE